MFDIIVVRVVRIMMINCKSIYSDLNMYLFYRIYEICIKMDVNNK